MDKHKRVFLSAYLLSGFNAETLTASLFSYLFSAVVITPLCYLTLHLLGENLAIKVLPFLAVICIAIEYIACKQLAATKSASKINQNSQIQSNFSQTSDSHGLAAHRDEERRRKKIEATRRDYQRSASALIEEEDLAKTPFSTVSILELPVHNVDMDATLAAIDTFIRSRVPHHVITADASIMVMALEDAELRAILSQAELITPDSAGIFWAAKQAGAHLRERVSGVEIVERLCALSPEQGYRLYFFGAGPGVAAQAAEKMAVKYPGAQIVGTRDGFFKPEETESIVADIRRCQPDILCVALGIPKQEKWIAAHRDALGVPVLIGVGGTLDVLSGTVRRAPLLFQVVRQEWLWRVLSNPKKLGKVLLLPRFVRLVKSKRESQVEIETKSDELLRPSHASDQSSEILLRPAMGGQEVDSELLLRPSENERRKQ